MGSRSVRHLLSDFTLTFHFHALEKEMATHFTILAWRIPGTGASGCTLEAKSLRDGKEELKRRGYKIVGVSPDSVKSHQNFCAKHELNFVLLADTDHSLSEALGVWQLKKMCGKEYMGIVRTTFILDQEARVSHIIEKVDTKDSYGQIVKLLDKE